MVEAEFQYIEPTYVPLHAIQERTVLAIVDEMKDTDGTVLPWNTPPVLVVEAVDEKGVKVLDGHHRLAAAAHLGLTGIPAFVISIDDYECLLNEKFGGILPAHMEDFCEHIMCDGQPGNSLSN